MTRVTTSDWEVISVDSSGGMADIGWTCPHCQNPNGGLIFFSATNVDVQNCFETDQECEVCGEKVIVECR